MGQSLAAQLGNNLLVRTGVVTLVLVGVFAVATGALPVRCMMGGQCDVANLPALPAEVATVAPQKTVLQGRPDVAVVKPVIGKLAPPSLNHNDVLAGTFEQLEVELKAPVSTAATRVAKATGPAKPETDSGLTTRMVRAVTINPDGTPDFGSTVAEAYASGGRKVTGMPPSPALDAAVRIGSGQRPSTEAAVTTAEAEPVAVAKPKVAAPVAAKGTATVVGSGANVRSTPSRGSKVLFALSGGEAVTIAENKRGWLHVTDDQGRSGWIYSDFVKRGG